jgi:hypothetical protein
MTRGGKIGLGLLLLLLVGGPAAAGIYYYVVFYESPEDRRRWRLEHAVKCAREADEQLKTAARLLREGDYDGAIRARESARVSIEAPKPETRREAIVENGESFDHWIRPRLAEFEKALLAACDAQLAGVEKDPLTVDRELTKLAGKFPKCEPLQAKLKAARARIDAARVAVAAKSFYVVIRTTPAKIGEPKVSMNATEVIEKALRERWPKGSELRLAMQTPSSAAERAAAWAVLEVGVEVRAVNYNVKISGRSAGAARTGLPVDVALHFKLSKPGSSRTSWDRLATVRAQRRAPRSIRGRDMWLELQRAARTQEAKLKDMLAEKLKSVPEFKVLGN